MGTDTEFAPSFTQKPQLHQEDDGNKLVFECELVSNPKPTTEWYRTDEKLEEGGRVLFKLKSLDGNKYQAILEINDVVEEDAGLYKVKAKNKLGEVAASINLNFSRKYIIYAAQPINEEIQPSQTTLYILALYLSPSLFCALYQCNNTNMDLFS